MNRFLIYYILLHFIAIKNRIFFAGKEPDKVNIALE